MYPVLWQDVEYFITLENSLVFLSGQYSKEATTVGIFFHHSLVLPVFALFNHGII